MRGAHLCAHLTVLAHRAMGCVEKNHAARNKTKFLKLRTPVTVGSLFGDWRVSWWYDHRAGWRALRQQLWDLSWNRGNPQNRRSVGRQREP